MPEARKATMADVEPLAQALALAFEDDPLTDFLFPETNRLDRIRRFFTYELRHVHLQQDETWTTPDVKSGALWARPGRWKQGLGFVLRSSIPLSRIVGSRSLDAIRVLSEIERAHPPGDHYYLATLGTDPSVQGKGYGSAVLEPVLQRCDEQGIGAYLESSKEKNLAFYNRHGFEVTRRLDLPRGGPPLWLMWREPRPDRA